MNDVHQCSKDGKLLFRDVHFCWQANAISSFLLARTQCHLFSLCHPSDNQQLHGLRQLNIIFARLAKRRFGDGATHQFQETK